MYAKVFLFIFFVGYTIVDGLKCKQCGSDDHEGDCRKGTVSATQTCSSGETQCATSVITNDKNMDSAYYHRACTPDTFCTQENKTYGRNLYYCNLCKTPECNNAYLFKDFNLNCMSCSGEGTNSECALGTSKNTEKCIVSKNTCFTIALLNGNTPSYWRGCGRKEYCDVQKELHGSNVASCSVCEGSNCNKQSAVRTCLKCKSTDGNSECQRGTVKSTETCPGTDCYAKLVQGFSTFGVPHYARGCASMDYCSELARKGQSVKFCVTCKDKDSCNTQPIKGSSGELSCVKCSDDSQSCVLGEVKSSEKCSGQQNACVEEYLENDEYSIAKRGCGNVDSCEKEKMIYGNKLKRCRICDSNNCNGEKFVPLKCYNCESSGSSCRVLGTFMPQITCSKISQVCFHRVYSTAFGTYNHRGCADGGYCKTSADITCQEYDEDLQNIKSNS